MRLRITPGSKLGTLTAGFSLLALACGTGRLEVAAADGVFSEHAKVTLEARNLQTVETLLRLRNSGDGHLALDSPRWVVPSAGLEVLMSGIQSLGPHEEQVATVRFTPPVEGASSSGAVALGSDGDSVNVEVQGVSLWCFLQNLVRFTPTVTGEETVYSQVMTNTTDTAAQLTIGPLLADSADFTPMNFDPAGTTTVTVPAKSTYTLQIRFHPQGAGPRPGKLIVSGSCYGPQDWVFEAEGLAR